MTGEQEKNPKSTTDAVGGLGWLERLFSIGRLWSPGNASSQASRGKRRHLRERKDNRQVGLAQGWQKLISGRGPETRQELRTEMFRVELAKVNEDFPGEPRKARRKIARMRLKLRAAEGRTAEARR